MRTIWKFPLALTDSQVILVPLGARILCVQVQNGQICLWAEVDSSRDLHMVAIGIAGTGHDVPFELLHYIGTVQTGPMVWHVYAGDVLS